VFYDPERLQQDSTLYAITDKGTIARDDWIGSVVTEMDKKAPGKILPSIQVYPYYIDDPFTVEDFRECTDEALKSPSQGVVFFSWPLFEKDPVRMEINSI